MSKFENLKKGILSMSRETKDFEIAAYEWELYSVKDVSNSTCLCKHNPIKECCFIKNNITNINTMVGNCCLNHFGGIPSVDWYFKGLRSIKNLTNPNIKMTQYLYAKQTLNDYDYTFLRSMHNKKKYSPSQRQYQQSILLKLRDHFYKAI